MTNLIIVSGPSGAGKGSLLSILKEKKEDYYFGISATTRAKRAEEVDGKEYYFLSKKTFETKIKENAFIEYCEVHGHHYGTLYNEYDNAKKRNKCFILEIDVQGAKKIKTQFPDSKCIFILPPNKETLKKRLKKRNTESEDEIEKRLKVSEEEMNLKKGYDAIIINDSLKRASQELINVIELMLKKK